MNPDLESLFAQGRLTEALARVKASLLSQPQNSALQFLLFELLSISEDFEGAKRALAEVNNSESHLKSATSFYLHIVNHEQARYEFLNRGNGRPNFVKAPPVYTQEFIKAIEALSQERFEEGEQWLKTGWQSVPKLSGRIDDCEFVSFRDCDDLVGPFLEVLTHESYFWIPFEQIRCIEFKKLPGYQNSIWMPAHLQMKDGKQGDISVPSLYSGTGSREDLLKLGQMTFWEKLSASENFQRAYGQRDFSFSERTQPSYTSLKGIRRVSVIVFD